MPEQIILLYLDPTEPTTMPIAVGPFASHEEAAEYGKAEPDTCGVFWTTLLVPVGGFE